jgi:hypothetical protein
VATEVATPVPTVLKNLEVPGYLDAKLAEASAAVTPVLPDRATPVGVLAATVAGVVLLKAVSCPVKASVPAASELVVVLVKPGVAAVVGIPVKDTPVGVPAAIVAGFTPGVKAAL